jgi:GNAT superfamily N-acetyltransferase
VSFSAVEKLAPEHDTSSFDCGFCELNDWLRRFALANQRANAVQTFAVRPEHTPTVVGYYALAAGSVERAQAPTRVTAGLARHPVPVILLARLAVDVRHVGQGLGAALLKDALIRIYSAAGEIGIRAVLVHAKDENARRFYQRYEFEASPVDECQLFLLIKDLRAMFGA